MRVSNWLKASIFTAALSPLSACLNPYALNISEVDYDSPQSVGVIQVTDAKLYSREALINERRDETEYLQSLLKASRTIEFAPQIIREVEYISALSASLGLAFDPSSRASYNSGLETAEVQQEIDELRLQLQLESLKRDAELLREQLPLRTELAGDPLAATIEDSASTSDISAPSTEALNTAINALLARLDSRLGATVPGAQSSKASIDPSDLFLDRAAYRDLIKSAMSAERLDDLHDKNGNALMRFHFSATVLPPAQDKMDRLGVLRMEVIKPVLSDKDFADLYRNWLNYVNENYNLTAISPAAEGVDDGKGNKVPAPQDGPIAERSYIPNPRFFYLGADSALYQTVSFALPKTPNDAGNCLLFAVGASSFAGPCVAVYIAVPVQDGLPIAQFDDIVAGLIANAPSERAAMDAAVLAGTGTAPGARAGLLSLGACAGTSSLYDTQEVINARSVLKTEPVIRDAYRNLLSVVVSNELPAHQAVFTRESYYELSLLFESARRLVDKAAGAVVSCNADSLQAPIGLSVPDAFKDAIKNILKDDTQVRIYDVSPREKAQQISTVTRAAEAINVAAAIAGNLPQSGIGFDAQSAFSRSASGKADARERAPLVVSFAEPSYTNITTDGKNKTNSDTAFGWLLGPKVAVNPTKKRLELSHYTAPYELTADLSVPSWWPRMGFNIQSAWTPDWRQGVGKTLSLNFTHASGGERPLERTLNVPLAPNAGDMSSLTDLLTAKRSSYAATLSPTITNITPAEISACAGPATLLVEGDNIWRSEKVIVGGREYTGSRVRVTPDMSGVLVDVDARSLPQAKTHVNSGGNADIDVYALNQDGEARGRIILRHLKKDGTCSGQLPKSTDPKITKVTLPKLSVCDPKPTFVIAGSNLSNASAVSLGAIGGKVTKKTATQVIVEFPTVKQKLAGIDKATLRLVVGKKPVEQEIEIYTPAKECLK